MNPFVSIPKDGMLAGSRLFSEAPHAIAGDGMRRVGYDGKYTLSAIPETRETTAATSASTSTHPFKVTRVSGNIYRVAAGLYEGYAIVEQTIDIGGTRPCAIKVKPKFTVTVWNSVFITQTALRTSGGHEPILTSSTADLNDVTTLTSAGDELRALIATVQTNGDITQYATRNITGVIVSNFNAVTAMATFYR